MMTFYMTQEAGWKNNFSIYNEAEELVYRIKGNIGMFTGTRSTIYDATETTELVSIKQRPFHYKWDIIIGGQVKATVSKKWFSLKSKYRIDGLNWQVTGKLLFHDYKITDDTQKEVAALHKVAFRLTDSFGIEVAEGQDPLLVLAIVVAIDAAIGQAGY